MTCPSQSSLNHLSSSEALCEVSEQIRLLQCEVASLKPNRQAGGLLMVGCPRLIIQYIRSWRPTPQSATQGKRHTVVTGTQGWIMHIL